MEFLERALWLLGLIIPTCAAGSLLMELRRSSDAEPRSRSTRRINRLGAAMVAVAVLWLAWTLDEERGKTSALEGQVHFLEESVGRLKKRVADLKRPEQQCREVARHRENGAAEQGLAPDEPAPSE